MYQELLTPCIKWRIFPIAEEQSVNSFMLESNPYKDTPQSAPRLLQGFRLSITCEDILSQLFSL